MANDADKRGATAKDPESTRGRILDAALNVFSNKGFHDASVDEIVEQSSTSKGSVYFHFPSKQTLFLALVDKFADLLERRVKEAIEGESEGISRVDIALTTTLQTFNQYRPLAKVMLVQAMGLGAIFEQKMMEVHTRFSNLIKIYLDEAIATGDIEPIDTGVVSRAWMGAINENVIHWVYSGEPTPERIMTTLRPMLLRSVGVKEHA
ncbi:MAG: TetR/AcrR family transcriptional regulator [Pleurocapsa minor GSE-CHR-MK-17-07R]|jgi:AcrR family transcriptional regulator|nr:TetR/AcrR family transcriptional regulator [Pleurocapsa minor GSE-CHR-MK 17-07R]